MDRPDDLMELSDGLACTACDEPIPADGVRILASREQLVFLQLDCQACESTTLGFVIADPEATPDPRRVPHEIHRGGPPVTADDVLDMHRLLETWSGDLASLIE